MTPSYLKQFLFLLVVLLTFTACGDEDEEVKPSEKPFVITDHFVAGTITPQSNSYTSVFFISLLENNKAVFMGTGNNLTGDYTLTKDSLIVTISDPNNYRIAKFKLNEKREVTWAYYKALTMEYKATGNLLPLAKENQLAGKTFKGEEFKMGPVSNRPNLMYKFNAQGTAFGTGVDAAALDANANAVELLNNSAFRYKSGSTTEIGFVNGNQLTVFRSSGLFYYGNYTQQ